MNIKKVHNSGKMLVKACNSLPVFTVHTSANPYLKPTCQLLNDTNGFAETPSSSFENDVNAKKNMTTGQNKIEFYRRKLPESCISFSSAEGKQIFKEALVSGHMDCYFPLAAQFRTQEEPAFCGLSTLVMVLNTLEIDPKKIWKGPWRWYHENMLDCCIPLHVVQKKGINMEQFSCLAACNMLKVKMARVDGMATEEAFRHLVKSVTRRTDQILVASYSRMTLGQTGDGHFSPIGGYNAEKDMVLIMDTARFKYPPHWVSLSLLYKAMQMVDDSSGLVRGYFLLSKNQFNPGLLFRLSPFFSPLGMDSKLISFFNLWEELLYTDLISTDMIGSEVARVAVIEVVRLLGGLQTEIFLITTQLDTKFAEAISYRHYYKNLVQLLSSLESLPFFSILASRSLNVDQVCLSRAGSASITDFQGDRQEDTECIQKVMTSLKPIHFLAAFMLSWPYQGCRPFSIGSNLHKYFASQLSRPSAKTLQNECARITQQLNSLVGYNKKCQQGCCH